MIIKLREDGFISANAVVANGTGTGGGGAGPTTNGAGVVSATTGTSSATTVDAPIELNIFQRNLHLLTCKQHAAFWIIYSLIPGILSSTADDVSWYATYRSTGTGTDAEHPRVQCFVNDSVLQGMYGLAALILCLLGIKIRTISDSFGIVKELKHLGLVALWFVIFDQIMTNTYAGWYGSLLFNVYYILISGVVWTINIAIPLYRSYHQFDAISTRSGEGEGLHAAAAAKYRRRLLRAGGGSGASVGNGLPIGDSHEIEMSKSIPFKSLDEVLRSPPARLAFERHLMTEFSIENLSFLDAVNSMREASTSPEFSVDMAREMATAIYE